MSPCVEAHPQRTTGMSPTTSDTATRQWTSRSASKKAVLLSLLAAGGPVATAQQCISLAGSTMCPAFNRSSVSTSSQLTDSFSFLSFVSDVDSFDTRLRQYVSTAYSQQKYEDILGCSDVNLTNTTGLYARYTTSVICNFIVQTSIDDCDLSGNATRPLCADACSDFAISEQQIISTPDLCGTPGNNAVPQIRSDFARCTLPDNALSEQCIHGVENEPDDCGFASNLNGLCGYCAASSPNATDSCCVNSKAERRCENVRLPTTTSMPPLFTSSTSSRAPTSTSTSSSGGSGGGSGLSGGAIAGIVAGSVVGALLLLALIIAACILMRRRRNDSQQGSIFNQPSPTRKGPPMSFVGLQRAPDVTPGGRVTRMSALEAASSSAPHSSPMMGGLYGSSDEYHSPSSQRSMGMAMMQKRDGSLSSHQNGSSSPGNDFSSPEGVASGQSEQLQFFKDYYSQDEIHAGDVVATLWAYQPRANDEFELERGDMLKVVGIWDDGWATGVRVREKAEEWEARRKENRDSGVSNGSAAVQRPPTPVATEGDIKAFPLVCVCLPQHWRKTIEGDTQTETGTSDPPPRTSAEP